MVSPRELPPPPPGAPDGWPWSLPAPVRGGFGAAGLSPRISVVTPSYNYGRFIEETVRSVLGQDYPDLEYIIVDGASTDGTAGVLGRYRHLLDNCIEEPDRGQTDAINKGFARCTGDLFVWLNADDAFASPTVLREVAELHRRGYEFIVGQLNMIDEAGRPLPEKQPYGESVPVDFQRYLRYWEWPSLPQPAVFVSRRLAGAAFPLDPELHYFMDHQFFLRCLAGAPRSVWMKNRWVNFKWHGGNKSAPLPSVRPDDLDRRRRAERDLVYPVEARRLPGRQRRRYGRAYRDRMELDGLLGRPKVRPGCALHALRRRPGLALIPLYWKVLARALAGERLYQGLKRRVEPE